MVQQRKTWLALNTVILFNYSLLLMALHLLTMTSIQGELENPNLLEAIPVAKTNIVPAYAMDINNSTIDGNMQAVERLMAQGGVGGSDCNGDTVDLSKHVVIIHGDLGTGKCIKSMMHERSLEYRPWERFQFIKFCPGFFHVKMACIDALWRIFIKPYPAVQ